MNDGRPIPTTYRHSTRQWDDTIWQSVNTEQVGSHFDEDERLEFAVLYNSIDVMRRLNREEDASDGSFAVLASPLPLDPGLRGHLVEVLESERQRVNLMNLIAEQQIDEAKDLVPGIAGSTRDPNWLQSFWSAGRTPGWCRAHGLPLAPLPTP